MLNLLLASSVMATSLAAPAIALQKSGVGSTSTRVPQGQALLDDLSRRAVTFFVQESNPVTGFTKDRASNLGAPDRFDISSIASTGFSLSAYAIGAERGWIPRDDALARSRNTAQQVLTKVPHYKGWFVHFYHWQTAARAWESEYSTIDTAIFLAGLLVAERAFKDPQLTATTNAILNRIDWSAMLTDGGAKPASLTFSHGYRPEAGGYLGNRWDWYSEQLILVLLGLGSWTGMPTGAWGAIDRPVATYQGIDTLVGGPIFLHHMSNIFVDFRSRRDAQGYDYWVSSRNAALAQIAYATANPKGWKGYGPNVWGLSACDSPTGYKAHGFQGFGEDDGTLAPMGAVTSVFLTRAESLRAAETLRLRYPNIFGRYGFSVSFNPTQNWVSPDVIGIDIGMMLLGIENARDRFPQRMAMSHPIIAKGIIRAGLKVTNEGAVASRPLKLSAR